MNLHQHLTWFWTGFFAFFGVYLLVWARNFAGPQTANCHVRLASPDADAANERIESAVTRREPAEGRPPRLGLWLGSWSLLLAAVAATGRVEPSLLYALLCLGAAVSIGAAFLRLRNSQPTRVAVLAARSPEGVIPPIWFYVAALSALMLLIYAGSEQYRWSALMVIASSLVTTAIAWRLTTLPALLSGVDVAAEQIVDERLRFHRSSVALFYATVQPFVFVSQTVAKGGAAEQAAWYLALVVWAAFGVWMIRRLFAKVQLA